MELEIHEWTVGGIKCKVIRELNTKMPGRPLEPGHWCGYVQIPKECELIPLIAQAEEWDVNVHGGITNSHQDTEGNWWVGFDCGHFGDALSPSRDPEFGHYWTIHEVRGETEKLVVQLLKYALGLSMRRMVEDTKGL
jgi:hypothetical protein